MRDIMASNIQITEQLFCFETEHEAEAFLLNVLPLYLDIDIRNIRVSFEEADDILPINGFDFDPNFPPKTRTIYINGRRAHSITTNAFDVFRSTGVLEDCQNH
jgi:hypothetical protein